MRPSVSHGSLNSTRPTQGSPTHLSPPPLRPLCLSNTPHAPYMYLPHRVTITVIHAIPNSSINQPWPPLLSFPCRPSPPARPS